MDKSYDVAIIGGGPAGYTAALYCARAGFSTLVLEMLSAGGQMSTTTQIDNYPGFNFGIDGLDLAEKMQAGAERFGAASEFAEVTAVSLSENPKIIQTTEGTVAAKAVVLCTGASPRKLGLAGEDELMGRGIAYCATCDGIYYRDKTVAVVGGGNSAATDALTLSKICKKVYLVHRYDELKAERIYAEPLEKADNVEFIADSQVDELVYGDRLVGFIAVNLKTGVKTAIDCDGLFVAIGRSPNTWLVKDRLELDPAGYIVADETTRTSLPGVFAAGDVRTKAMRQIITAAADGAVASKFIQQYIQTGLADS